MTARTLSADEQRLWGAVMATVRPLRGVAVALPALPKSDAPAADPPFAPSRSNGRSAPGDIARKKSGASTGSARAEKRSHVADTLDASWDKRLARGMVAPDASIDLHGHTLASAHALLDAGLQRSIARGDRVLLLVTGKPPRTERRPESERPHARGAIRAVVADWLAASRHADAIAAVRSAHPRHGGAGALYIVLRRARQPA